MVSVKVKNDEPFERALRRFKKKWEKAGILKDIMWLPANDVYIVLNGDKESLIPVIDEIIIRLDLESKKIIIADIDGLLDI